MATLLNYLRRFVVTNSEFLVALSLAAISYFFLIPFRSAIPSPDPDEGIILQGAARVLRGEVLYRDFFSFYAPGSYYSTAFIFRLAGDSLTSARTLLLLYGAIFSSLTYLLARSLKVSRTSAVFTTMLALICCLPVRFLVMHNWDATIATLFSLCCGWIYLHKPGRAASFLWGLFTACALLFNQARGAGAVLGYVLGIAVLLLRGDIRPRTKHILFAATGFAVPLLATIIFFAGKGALTQMMHDLMWPHLHYSAVNRLPYGYITMRYSDWNDLFVSGPLLPRLLRWLAISPILMICAAPILVALVALQSAWLRKDLPRDETAPVILCGGLVAGSLIALMFTRPDFHHVTYLLPLFVFVLPWIAERWLAAYPALHKVLPLVITFVAVSFAAYGMTLYSGALHANQRLETRRGTVRTLLPNQTIPYVQAHVPVNADMLVYPYLPMYSFLTRTYSPLHFEYFQPGMTTQEQFSEAVAELGRAKPNVVLFENQFDAKIPAAWPRTPLGAIARDPIADYIVHNYRVCRTLDDQSARFLYMVRRDLPCPK